MTYDDWKTTEPLDEYAEPEVEEEEVDPEPPEQEPEPDFDYTPYEESAHYRESMRDAGRGHLLR